MGNLNYSNDDQKDLSDESPFEIMVEERCEEIKKENQHLRQENDRLRGTLEKIKWYTNNYYCDEAGTKVYKLVRETLDTLNQPDQEE